MRAKRDSQRSEYGSESTWMSEYPLDARALTCEHATVHHRSRCRGASSIRTNAARATHRVGLFFREKIVRSPSREVSQSCTLMVVREASLRVRDASSSRVRQMMTNFLRHAFFPRTIASAAIGLALLG